MAFNYFVVVVFLTLKLFVFYYLENDLVKLDFVFEKSENGLVVHVADNGSPVDLLYWDGLLHAL